MESAQGAVPDAPSLVPQQPGGSPDTTGNGTSSGAGDLVESGFSLFTETALFDQVQTFSTIAGVGVVVFVAFYIIKSLTAGMASIAIKTGVVGAIIAAMLFNLRAPIAFAAGLTGFVESIFQFVIDTLERAG